MKPRSSSARYVEPLSERLLCLVACPLLLLTPLAIFLKHHGYDLLRPEVLITAGIAVLAALPFGILAAATPRAVRVFILGAFVVLFAEIQFPWIDSWSRVLVALVVSLSVLYCFRHRAASVIALLTVVMLLVTLPLPAGPGWVQRHDAEHTAQDPPDLPLVIHIVLDEQIGVEGIPTAFDPQGRVRSLMKRVFLDRGFELFGRAFAQYYETSRSLSQVLSLSNSPPGVVNTLSGHLLGNVYLETMAQRGYPIHVYQSDYIDFCEDQGDFDTNSCATYTLESVKAIEDARLSTGDKADLMVGMFVRLSFILDSMRRAYGNLTRALAKRGIEWPEWPEEIGRVSSLSAMAMFEEVEDALIQAKPGELHFVHLMLPHFPFAYDESCQVRPSPRDWLTSNAPSAFPRRNNWQTRRKRYPLYLEQVTCTQDRLGRLLRRLDDAGILDDALVIVHGDHGSRIDTGPPKQRLAPKLHASDYVDAYSTLFAWHAPGGTARYDDRMLPIGALLTAIVEQGAIPDGQRWAGPPEVYLQPEEASAWPPVEWPGRRMPGFGKP